MPFPFILQENFETGTQGAFNDPPQDALGKLDFPDHREDLVISPWRGGYVMRVAMDRGTDDAYVQHDTALDIGPGENRYIRLYLMVGADSRFPDFAGASVKFFRVFAAGVEQFAVGISCSETELWGPRLVIWTLAEAQAIDGLAFDQGVWLPIQIIVKNDNPTGQVFLQYGANLLQVTRLAFSTFTHFQIGAMAQSPKIRGTLYFDDIIIDTAKLEEPGFISQDQLWGNSQIYTKSSYAFVGPGTLRGATLIGSGTDANTAYLYDADRLPLSHHDIKGALKVAVGETKDTQMETFTFQRGCYVQMLGTNPQVIIHYGERGAV